MIAQYIDSDDKIDLVRFTSKFLGTAVSCSVAESVPVSSPCHDPGHWPECRGW